MTIATQSWRSAAYTLLEGHKEGGGHSKLIRRIIIVLILLNGLAVILESNADLYAAYAEWFDAFELFSVTIFTIEYLCRVWVSAEKRAYAHLPSWRARSRTRTVSGPLE